MSVSENYFLNNAFGIHRYYFYHKVAENTRKINDEEELKKYNQEINLFSMFQFRMKTDPCFQQFILSIIENDEGVFKRTGEYLKYLQIMSTAKPEFFLYGNLSIEEFPSSLDDVSQKNPKYVLYSKQLKKQSQYMNKLLFNDEEGGIMYNLMDRSYYNDLSVGWNTVVLFAFKRYHDGDFAQRMILDWKQYFSKNLKDICYKYPRYDSLDVLFRDNTFPSNMSLNKNKKLHRLVITVNIPQKNNTFEEVRNNYFNGIQYLLKYREKIVSTYFQNIVLSNYCHNFLSKDEKEHHNIFIEFTNDFLQTACELWFLSLSETEKLKCLNKEYVFSPELLCHDERSSEEFINIAESIIKKGYRTSETLSVAKKIYECVLQQSYELSPIRRKYLNYRMNRIEKFDKDTIVDRIIPDINITPVTNGSHPVITKDVYSLLYNNPEVIDEKTAEYLQRTIRDITEAYSKRIFETPEEQENFFLSKEEEGYLYYEFSNNPHPFPLICLISLMYITYYWCNQSEEWFINKIPNYYDKFTSSEKCVISQLKSDYFMKRGLSTKSMNEMKNAEQYLEKFSNQDLLWEFWIRYANVSLQNREFNIANRCFKEILKIDSKNDFYQNKILEIKDYLEKRIVVSERFNEIIKDKNEFVNYFIKGDDESSLFYSLDLEIQEDSIGDVSSPLIQYAWGLDAFFGEFIWINLYHDLKLEEVDDDLKLLPRFLRELVGAQNRNKKPSLGIWVNFLNNSKEMSNNKQNNKTLKKIIEYLISSFGTDGLLKISESAELLKDYRNDICHAKPVIMNIHAFYEIRKKIVHNINDVINFILNKYMERGK